MRFLLFAIHSALCALPSLLVLVLLPDVVSGQGLVQGISGSLEFEYSVLSSKTTDASGNTVKTNTQTYSPRFTLDINTKIFPTLKVRAGGIAEGTKSNVEINGADTKATVLDFRPYFDLTLDTGLFKAAVGYSRRQERTKVLHSPSVTLVNDEFYGLLTWKPEGLPLIDMQIRRRNSFDTDKSFLDTKEDFIGLTSRYQYQGLQLDYRGTYSHSKDNLVDITNEQYTHTGRAVYSNSFFDKRITLNTTYNISYQEIRTASTGKGFISSQVFPVAGLSSFDDFPPPFTGTLDPNPALIDGDLAASAGLNIGLIPIGGDRRRRNIGLDFGTPTEVNKIFVWVDRELPLDTASAFPWDIYVSSDNLNWTLVTTLFSAPFGPFQNRFEVKFSNITARYIKVVTRVLTLGDPGASGFPDIFITEMQAFLDTSAKEAKQKISRTTHIYDLDLRARILDNPSLSYELYYSFNRFENDGSARQRYSFSNALQVFHRFNEVFSGQARVAREDGKQIDKETVASYLYNASITADPLRTVHSNLTFNGRDEEIGGRSNSLKSVFLYNTAQLYSGLDAGLNGGVSFIKQEDGRKGRNTIVSLTSNIVPHRALTLGLNYSNTISRQTGGGQESSSKYSQSLDFNLSYNPLRTLNFIALIQVIAERGEKTQTTQNYSINWSPFPDGALQFNMAYNENYRSLSHEKERIVQPTIRYNISKSSYLDVSYQVLRRKSDIEKTSSNLFSTNLKIYF